MSEWVMIATGFLFRPRAQSHFAHTALAAKLLLQVGSHWLRTEPHGAVLIQYAHGGSAEHILPISFAAGETQENLCLHAFAADVDHVTA